MLRIIFLSLFWAVCSTCLIRPWFWKGVKEKDLFNHGNEKIGFSDTWESDVVLEIFFFVVTFLLGILIYGLAGCRQDIYGSLPLIALCFLFQIFWKNQGRARYIFIASVIVISILLWLQDGIVGEGNSAFAVSINKVETVPISASTSEQKSFISADDIKALFKVDSAKGPTYNNGKYVFTVEGRDIDRGVVVIDKNNYNNATLLHINYDFYVENIRAKYPTKKLRTLYIAISDDNTPYGVFATANKTWLLGHYVVDGYLLFNLNTGETESFSQEDLPEFVTNND